MAESTETARIIGAITEAQRRTDTALQNVAKEQGRLRTTMSENHEKSIQGLADVKERVALLDQKLDTHVIASEGPHRGKGRTVAKAGGLTGLGGTLAFLGDWLYTKLSGG